MPAPTHHNIHDKFFRSAMEHKRVAVDFIQHHFPKKISQALNTETLKLLQQSYIDKELRESSSDLVFSCELANKPARLTLLIEHQSSPNKMMPFRVLHYLCGMLNSYMKQNPNTLLPAVYTLVFYHGEQTPYPYSLSLEDCFDDPLKLIPDMVTKPLRLIDVNQLSDKELKQQEWVGPMALAMKHIRQTNLNPYAIDILASLPWTLDSTQESEILDLLLKYLLRAGNIQDVNIFMTQHAEQLSRPVRRAVMTAAEQLEAIGLEKGMEKGKQQGLQQGIQKGMQKGLEKGELEKAKKIAIKMLEEGTDIAFITKVTELSIEDIEHLRIE